MSEIIATPIILTMCETTMDYTIIYDNNYYNYTNNLAMAQWVAVIHTGDWDIKLTCVILCNMSY